MTLDTLQDSEVSTPTPGDNMPLPNQHESKAIVKEKAETVTKKHKSKLRSEPMNVEPQWNFLTEKREEYGIAGQEWVWESRAWTPHFLKKFLIQNAWCRDEYGL